MALKLQTVEVDGEVLAKTKDGKPLYIEDSNQTEVPFDAETVNQNVKRLNREAMNHREAKEAAEQKLATFADLDPEEARKALNTVANLEKGDLLAADKVEELKASLVKSVEQKYEGQLKGLQTEVGKYKETVGSLTNTLHTEKLTNAFATSKYIQDKLILPAPAAQDIFARNFKVEDGGKIVAYSNDGHKIYSQQNSGQEPDFDEALSIIVGEYKYRDSVLKGTGNTGGGGEGTGTKFAPGEKKMLRAEFDRLDQNQRRKVMASGVKLVDQ
jgi:hypothetical protein